MPELQAAEAAKLSHSGLLDDTNDKSGALSRFVHSLGESFYYRAVAAPVKALGQVFDNSYREDIKPPEKAKDSAGYYGQLFGEAAAITSHLLLAKKIGGACAKAAPVQEIEALSLRREFLKGAAFGFAYEGALTPSSSEDLANKGLLRSRFENATSGAAVFGTMNANAALIKNMSLAAEAGGYKNVSAVLANQPLIGALSGIPGGFVGAESNALLKQGRFASFSEVNESIYSMGIVGLGFGTLSHLAEPANRGTAVENTSGKGAYNAPLQNAPSLMDSFLSKMDSLADRANAAIDHLIGPQMQPAFAFATDASPFSARSRSTGSADVPSASEFRPLLSEPLAVKSTRIETIQKAEMSSMGTGGGGDAPPGLLKFREFIQSDIVPKIKQAESWKKVSTTVELPNSMSHAQQLDLQSSLRNAGYVVELYKNSGSPSELFLSWSPFMTQNPISLTSIFGAKPEVATPGSTGFQPGPRTPVVEPTSVNIKPSPVPAPETPTTQSNDIKPTTVPNPETRTGSGTEAPLKKPADPNTLSKPDSTTITINPDTPIRRRPTDLRQQIIRNDQQMFFVQQVLHHEILPALPQEGSLHGTRQIMLQTPKMAPDLLQSTLHRLTVALRKVGVESEITLLDGQAKLTATFPPGMTYQDLLTKLQMTDGSYTPDRLRLAPSPAAPIAMDILGPRNPIKVATNEQLFAWRHNISGRIEYTGTIKLIDAELKLRGVDIAQSPFHRPEKPVQRPVRPIISPVPRPASRPVQSPEDYHIHLTPWGRSPGGRSPGGRMF